MLNRAQVATRYRMIPGLVSATLYRKGADDEVASQQAVSFVEFKTPKAIRLEEMSILISSTFLSNKLGPS